MVSQKMNSVEDVSVARAFQLLDEAISMLDELGEDLAAGGVSLAMDHLEYTYPHLTDLKNSR
jgi:hypothetical protein